MRKVQIISQDTISKFEIVDAIKANNDAALKLLYQANYAKVEALVLKNSGTRDHAKDIYQDAFIAVWRNIKENKFIPESETAIHGYLYRIAKNKWMDYLRSKDYKKTIVTDKASYVEKSENTFEPNDDDILEENRLQSAMQAFRQLGLPCKSLLTKFYFEKKSMTEIANELKIDAASTRNKKYRCMKKLRELALNLK